MTSPAPARRSPARTIVKVGSSLLVSPEGEVRRDWLATLVADIAARHKAGEQPIPRSAKTRTDARSPMPAFTACSKARIIPTCPSAGYAASLLAR